MDQQSRAYAQGISQGTHAVSVNKVLKNTYLLLGMNVIFSAFTCGVAMAMNLSPILGLVAFGASFVISFFLHKYANSTTGLVLTFADAGLLGVAIGPTLNYYLFAYSNGGPLILLALGMTAAVFFGLSGYALTTRKDFSFMTGFIVSGMMVAFVAMLGLFGLAAFGIQIAALSLGFSALVVMLMSAAILWQTSRIIHGGETNYILAAAALYGMIWSLFVNLLHLVMAFAGED